MYVIVYTSEMTIVFVCVYECALLVPSCCNFHLQFSSLCCDWQVVSAAWMQDYSKSVLRVPTCTLPGMATFVSTSKPNFRVTSTRDPNPLISYPTDGWTPAYSQNSLLSPTTSHSHEMRASVIMKTSDVTSSWPQMRKYHQCFQSIGTTGNVAPLHDGQVGPKEFELQNT